MLQVHTSLTDETRGYRFVEFTDEFDDSWTTGELFRAMQKEYGRCVSRVYVDTADGKAQPVGWYFESRQPYSDARKPSDTYIRGAWITVQHVERCPECNGTGWHLQGGVWEPCDFTA